METSSYALYPHLRVEFLRLIQAPRAVLQILLAAAQGDAVVPSGIKPLRGCPVAVVLHPTAAELPKTRQGTGCDRTPSI